MTKTMLFLFLVGLWISACGSGVTGPLQGTAAPPSPAAAAATIAPSVEPATALPPQPTLTLQPSSTATLTPTSSPTATATPTPSITPTATISPTPTFDFPDVTVLMQANCRYGPGTAYLYSFGLYPGDRAEVNGRNSSGSWLWIQPENLDRHCWVSASVVEVSGDLRSVAEVTTKLPHTALYGPPQNVRAVRDGSEVTVTWERVWMTVDDDRGYLIEATLCQGGSLVWVAVHTELTFYQFSDEKGCSGESGGKLYTVDKHGYTDPVTIPWP